MYFDFSTLSNHCVLCAIISSFLVRFADAFLHFTRIGRDKYLTAVWKRKLCAIGIFPGNSSLLVNEIITELLYAQRGAACYQKRQRCEPASECYEKIFIEAFLFRMIRRSLLSESSYRPVMRYREYRLPFSEQLQHGARETRHPLSALGFCETNRRVIQCYSE